MKLITSSAKNLSVFFSRLELYMIHDSFSSAVFLRAKSYVQRVKMLSQTDTIWRFEVTGSKVYQVRLERKVSQIEGTCTCAHYNSGERCKHMAAAMMWGKENPLVVKITSKELATDLIKDLDSLLSKVNSRWNKNTAAFNAVFGERKSDIWDLLLDGQALLFAELWERIIKKITDYGVFSTLTTKGGYYGNPKWETAVVFIQITKAILKEIPLKERIDWLERLILAQQEERVLDGFMFEAVFEIKEMLAVKTYTLKNIKNDKKQLPQQFFEAQKDSFSHEEQMAVVEELVKRDETYYPEIIALLAKKPDEQRKYMRKYYLEYAPKPTKLKSWNTYIKNLIKADLSELITPLLDQFFKTYVYQRDEDYAYIEKHFSQYLRQFCDNSYADSPYQFYRSLQTNGLHSEMRLYLKDIVEQKTIKHFSSLLPDTAEGAWVRFYKKYSKYYHQEAFDFYREALAQIMPPKSPRQSQLFIDILDGLMDIEPVYTMALIDVICESYPKNISFLTKLGDFVAEQAAKNKGK